MRPAQRAVGAGKALECTFYKDFFWIRVFPAPKHCLACADGSTRYAAHRVEAPAHLPLTLAVGRFFIYKPALHQVHIYGNIGICGQ